MSSQVQLVANGSHLVRTLYAATITVLLLTSPFSSETTSAVRTVSQAAALTTCPSVQYVQYSLRPGERVQEPWRWFRFVNDAPSVVRNLTLLPPLFPFIRLFHSQQTPSITDFYGSFDALVLARFISNACGVDLDFPRVASRDEFARAIRYNALGALLIVPMSEGRLQRQHLALAHAVSDAAQRRSSWVFSVVDSEKDVLFARRVANESLLFVNLAYDKAVLHDVSEVTADNIQSLMQRFEQISRRTVVRDASLVPFKQLLYFDGVSMGRSLLRFPKSDVSLRAFLSAQYTVAASRASVLWVVVIQTWCAYCQRIVPVYERFAQIASACDADVDVLFVQHTELLPPFLDRLVDGFPTVLRLELFEGVREVHEYVGEHELDALVDEHREWQSDRLWAAQGAMRFLEGD